MISWGNDRFVVVLVNGSTGHSYGIVDQQEGKRLGLYDTRDEADKIAHNLNHGV